MSSVDIDPSLLEDEKTFDSFGLDERLLKGIYSMGWKVPTVVQSAAISLSLEGKDILAKAKTGSGKTAAYSIPIIQTLLLQKAAESKQKQGTKAVVLVPTGELCTQVKDHFSALLKFCKNTLVVYDLSATSPIKEQKIRLAEKPDIVVATPGRLLEHLKAKSLSLTESLKMLVIDEADHILSFGYEDDVHQILSFLPKIFQAFMMSATLNAELDGLKRSILHTPAVLQLDAPEDVKIHLKEFYYKCNTLEDKFLILYSLLRLKVIPGKAIIFVNSINFAYKVKLFLDRFTIPSAVLNSELPLNSRYDIIQQFNRGVFDYLIATDESFGAESKKEDKTEEEEDEEMHDEEDEDAKENESKEYGVARGVDFKGVQTVLNFETPSSTTNYVHRVGRTARGGAKGSALTLATVDREATMLGNIIKDREESGITIQAYQLNFQVIDAFRYRVGEILRSCSKRAVLNSRMCEVKNEIVNSEKLKSHFVQNPEELQALVKHAKPSSRPNDVGLQVLPNYLLPQANLQAVKNLEKKPIKKLARKKGSVTDNPLFFSKKVKPWVKKKLRKEATSDEDQVRRMMMRTAQTSWNKR